MQAGSRADLQPELPSYIGIDPAHVRLVRSEADAQQALAALLADRALWETTGR